MCNANGETYRERGSSRQEGMGEAWAAHGPGAAAAGTGTQIACGYGEAWEKSSRGAAQRKSINRGSRRGGGAEEAARQ